MKIINLISIILLLVMFAGNVYLIDKNLKSKEHIETLASNINVLGTDNQFLTFTNKELKKYISNKDTQHKREVDSILKSHDVKVKSLKKYQKITVTSIDIDTAKIHFTDIKILPDSLFELKYEKSVECLYLSGRILSKDKNTEFYLDSIKSENKVYITESYKKTFFDWLFRRPGKLETKISSECGSTQSETIDIK